MIPAKIEQVGQKSSSIDTRLQDHSLMLDISRRAITDKEANMDTDRYQELTIMNLDSTNLMEETKASNLSPKA